MTLGKRILGTQSGLPKVKKKNSFNNWLKFKWLKINVRSYGVAVNGLSLSPIRKFLRNSITILSYAYPNFERE